MLKKTPFFLDRLHLGLDLLFAEAILIDARPVDVNGLARMPPEDPTRGVLQDPLPDGIVLG